MTARVLPWRRAGGLHFDEPSHVYKVGQIEVPSVTQILKATGVSVDFDRLVARGVLSQAQLLEKRELGRAAHIATHYYDEGDLRADSVDPRVMPYLRAWVAFRDVTGFTPATLETQLHHPGILVAGTLDRAGYFAKFANHDPRDLYVVDLKLGDPDDAAAQWQTAAYTEMLRANLQRSDLFDPGLLSIRPRYSVQLLPSEKFRLCRYDDTSLEWIEFCQYVTTFRRQAGRRAIVRHEIEVAAVA